MTYPWYQKLNPEDELQQGDFIDDCPVVIPPAGLKPDDEVDMIVELMNVIILSQSCDLANKDIPLILVCPYYTVEQYFENLSQGQIYTPKAKRKKLEDIKKGQIVAYHLLNKEEGIVDNYLIVDFKNVYGVHRNTITEIAIQLENRIRLLPPYREHLSQAFARYFMRVGLPQDITIEGF